MGKVKAGKPKSKRSLREVGKETIDKIVAQRTFEPYDKPQVGERIHRFRERGEYVEGFLGEPIKNFRQSVSYPIETEDEQVIEIFANRLLHKFIGKFKLQGNWVRIQYIGREDTNYGGHKRKIFRVFVSDKEMRPSLQMIGQTTDVRNKKKKKTKKKAR